MGIKKYYAVTCDKCGCLIRRYHGYKPTPTDLRKRGISIRINNGHIFTFCERCKNKDNK